MALRSRGGPGEGLNAWPGYVDALSTLLMVIIFVLLVFVLAQAFLSVALSGRDQALDRVNRQMAELSDMLSLERGRTAGIAAFDRATSTATCRRRRRRAIRWRSSSPALRAERTELTRRARCAEVRARQAGGAAGGRSGCRPQSAQARADQLQAQLADLAKRHDATAQERPAAAQLAETRRLLAKPRSARMRRQSRS